MATEETIAPARDAIEVREIDRLVVAGQSHAQVVYEIVGRKGKVDLSFLGRYAEGLEAYRARRWDDAAAAFSAAPSDGPSQIMAKRVEVLRNAPPSPDWDGAWRLTEK